MPAFLTAFVLFLAGLSVCSAQSRSETDLLTGFRALADYKIIRADFVQTRHVAELDMKIEIKGEMICENGGRLRWQVNSPVCSVSVIDKEQIRYFDAEAGKTLVIQQSRFPWLKVLRECLADWISGDPERLGRRFERMVLPPRTLRLLPKESTLKQIFKSVEIRANPEFNAIETIVIEELSGYRLEIRFVKVQKNPVLPYQIWRMPPT